MKTSRTITPNCTVELTVPSFEVMYLRIIQDHSETQFQAICDKGIGLFNKRFIYKYTTSLIYFDSPGLTGPARYVPFDDNSTI